MVTAQPYKRVLVQAEDFDLAMEMQQLRRHCPQAGAVVSFDGLVREFAKGQVLQRMHIEHYPGMTEKALLAIVEQALHRWPLLGVTLIHRYGDLEARAQIVMVATASLHRQAAFDACAFMMDFLKTEAPFWKKEIGALGARWVEAREADEQAKQQWSLPE
ncbi:molybdenum cofactor biosynthesis protein MoaE [Methylophilus aquaticus]|uniref:Molybdopterin synthase catalytic subunit n=1 Tax=Methylophilus aquaticus TaxID=1971610 RepID=A0ABT9JTA6_9PROT|nr:molybdenum cofactor biosynthesis protein MoaE [Methylophilus aquaticus]MDP8567719.1 molybdenum cofactor biosynthesis protein MoaE [Methylophilus aquaticus]